jgi:hypothetical protein
MGVIGGIPLGYAISSTTVSVPQAKRTRADVAQSSEWVRSLFASDRERLVLE